MDPALAPGAPQRSAIFTDGLGERRRVADVSRSDTVELLCLRDELTAIPSFEFALRERASRLAGFKHASFGRVRSVDRLNDTAATLAVVSDAVKGVRLSNLLAATERRPLTLDINASLHLIRQLVAGIAALHEHARDVTHGALGPERIIVTPSAHVVIVEYVLGAALEQLHFSHGRYWKELRIALPPSPGLPRFDHRADVSQIGAVALAMILGRPLHEDEYPARVGDVLASASAITSTGDLEPLPNGLRAWIGRALQLDARRSFASALEARDELDRVLKEGEEVEEEVPAVGEVRVPAPSKAEAAPAPKVEPAPMTIVSTATADIPGSWGIEAPSQKSQPAQPRTAPQPIARQTRGIFEDIGDGDDIEESAPSASRPAAAGLALLAALGTRSRAAAVAAVLLIVSTGGAYGARRWMSRGSQGGTGSLSMSSNPPGAQMLVDGRMYGVTPLTVTLKAGSHVVELRGGGEPRAVPVTIVAGTQISQYMELPQNVTAFGELQIRSEPVGAQVTVDGIPRGKTPVLVESLAAGDHAVVLEGSGSTIKQSVAVEAGQVASLVVPLTTPETAPLSGWISVAAPVEVELFENKKLIGTSQSDRIMVAAGKHEIEVVNEPLGYRAVKSVQITPGKLSPLKLEWPKGIIAINALPWAEVWIDGEKVGETPIGNLSLPIGPHEIVFKHPDLGEQKYAATVSLKEPARVSVDLRKKGATQ